MIKSDREALSLLKSDYSKHGQIDVNNAVVRRLQAIAQKGTGEQFFNRAKKFLSKVSKQQNYRNYEKEFYNFIGAKFKLAIEKNRRKLITSRLDLFITKFDEQYQTKLDQKEKDAYEKGKDAIDRAREDSGEGKGYLAGPRLSRELSRDKSNEPKIVKKQVTPEKKETKIDPVWEIEFKDITGIANAILNAKILFKDMLDGKSGTILKSGMNETDDQKLQIAAIQQKLGIDIDGDFGPDTKEAIEKFQKENNLDVDGRVGRQTITAMFSETAKGIAKNVPITGKDIDPVMVKTVDNLTKNRQKEYITPAEILVTDQGRKVNLDDKAQRGIKESRVYHLKESQIRYLVRNILRESL